MRFCLPDGCGVSWKGGKEVSAPPQALCRGWRSRTLVGGIAKSEKENEASWAPRQGWGVELEWSEG